jgi:hypothetical protein
MTETQPVQENREKLLQLAMAFGQGAGSMLAAEEGIKTALAPYERKISEVSGRWSQVAVIFIEYARILGHLSAVHAAQAGRCVITSEDVEVGLRAIQANTLDPFMPCGC